MPARPGVVVAFGLLVLGGGLAQDARAAWVSLASTPAPSTAHLLSSASANHSRAEPTAVLLWSLYFQQWLQQNPAHLSAWWSHSPEGMSTPPTLGGEGGSPQLCALDTVPSGTSLYVVARLALQEQTSLPPPLASRLFRPPRQEMQLVCRDHTPLLSVSSG